MANATGGPPPAPRQSKRPAIPSLTGLRFYAAAFIVWAHIVGYYFQNETAHHPLQGTWRIADWGMTLFFVLSGFVIHYNYGDSVSKYRWPGLRTFLVARFARLYPLYIFVLSVDLVLHGPSTFSTPEFQHVWPFYLTLTQNCFPLHFDGKLGGQIYMAGAWSISAEVMLYIFYLILVRPLRWLQTPRGVLLTIAVLSLSATVFQVCHATLYWFPEGETRWWFYLSPLCRVPEFSLGALCAQLLIVQASEKPQCTERSYLRVLPIAALIWTAGLFACSAFVSSMYFGDVLRSWWGFAPPSAMLIYYFARYRSVLSVAVEHRFIVLLGDASYSIYMLQGYMLSLLAGTKVPTGWFADFRIFLTCILIVLISLGTYTYLEVPARRLIRGLLDRRPAEATKLAPRGFAPAGQTR